MSSSESHVAFSCRVPYSLISPEQYQKYSFLNIINQLFCGMSLNLDVCDILMIRLRLCILAGVSAGCCFISLHPIKWHMVLICPIIDHIHLCHSVKLLPDKFLNCEITFFLSL